ncbi:MAG: hypothetical protein EON59_07170 [Alphaproteobacteria bacterium]|nr:MAG: hypothetical protein EON59_07170 [Alphaproteobacteria bacterium]
MAFIIKSDPQPLTVDQRVLVSVKRYEAADPRSGDDVYFWHSETTGGSGLAARGVITAVSDEDPVDLAVTITAAAPVSPIGVAALRSHRDVGDNSPITGLAKILYRHSLNKVARLSQDEAALLAGHWEAR